MAITSQTETTITFDLASLNAALILFLSQQNINPDPTTMNIDFLQQGPFTPSSTQATPTLTVSWQQET